MWPFRSTRIYLDHASATPLCDEALRAVKTAWDLSGNPSSLHQEGVAAKRVLEESRTSIAGVLQVKPREVLFTSGSTEGNNLCIVGYAHRILRDRGTLSGTHWIVSSIEHPSVLESFGEVERLGGTVTFVDPDKRGFVSPESIEHVLRPDTALVSIGWANSETGVVQPLRAIAQMLTARSAHDLSVPLLHSDLGQAPLYRIPHVHTLGLDMAVMGSGKLYGPRGIAAVFLSDRVVLDAQSWGGEQERGLRAGTENPALAAGFAAALSVLAARRESDAIEHERLRDILRERLVGEMTFIENTPRADVLPHILNISIPGIDPEYIVLALDRAGIAISTKSACKAGEKSSHVVAALGGTEERARTTLRFSLGRSSTEAGIRTASDALIHLARDFAR
jgi:cysteine desulfurase